MNLSRIDPRSLCVKVGRGAINPAIQLRGNDCPAICVSVIRVGESFLIDPKPVNSKSQKILTGTFHSMEYERFVAVLCVVFGVNEVRTQTAGNMVAFSTRQGDFGEYWLSICSMYFKFSCSDKADPSFSAKPSSSKNSGLFSGISSPATSKPFFSGARTSLDVNDCGDYFTSIDIFLCSLVSSPYIRRKRKKSVCSW